MTLVRARSFAVAGLLGLVLVSVLPIGAAPRALAQAPTGSFACRSTPVSLLGAVPIVANPGTNPCADDSRNLLGPPIGDLGLQAVSARTERLPAGGGATSHAQVAGIDLAALGISIGVIEADATVTCQAGQPRLSGRSTVAGLAVSGQAVPSTAPIDLSLGVGTLHLNHTAASGSTLTQRAVWLETAVGSVVLGEAHVGVTGNPCIGGDGGDGSITVALVSDPKSTQAFSFVGDLGPFTLRDDGRSGGADRRTFPLSAGQYSFSGAQPTGRPRVERAWDPSEVECTDPDGATIIIFEQRTVQVDLDAGEDIVCTFFNKNGRLAATGGDDDIENRARGLDPVADKRDQDSRSRDSRADIPPPPPPTSAPIDAERSTGGSSSAASTGLVAVPLVAILAGALWFLLAGARRRRDDETA